MKKINSIFIIIIGIFIGILILQQIGYSDGCCLYVSSKVDDYCYQQNTGSSCLRHFNYIFNYNDNKYCAVYDGDDECVDLNLDTDKILIKYTTRFLTRDQDEYYSAYYPKGSIATGNSVCAKVGKTCTKIQFNKILKEKGQKWQNSIFNCNIPALIMGEYAYAAVCSSPTTSSSTTSTTTSSSTTSTTTSSSTSSTTSTTTSSTTSSTTSTTTTSIIPASLTCEKNEMLARQTTVLFLIATQVYGSW